MVVLGPRKVANGRSSRERFMSQVRTYALWSIGCAISLDMNVNLLEIGI